MAKVTNNHDRDLGLPGGFVIGAGKAEDVPGWDKLSKHKVVAKWLESGVLSAGKSSKKDEPEDEPEVVEDVQFTEEVPADVEVAEEAAEEEPQGDEDAQKEAIIAQLKELDIKADKRSSVEKLQEKLDEALAK